MSREFETSAKEIEAGVVIDDRLRDRQAFADHLDTRGTMPNAAGDIALAGVEVDADEVAAYQCQILDLTIGNFTRIDPRSAGHLGTKNNAARDQFRRNHRAINDRPVGDETGMNKRIGDVRIYDGRIDRKYTFEMRAPNRGVVAQDGVLIDEGIVRLGTIKNLA